jgi:hypothetical protein
MTRTWTASDECGNSSTASQTITVDHTAVPVITGVPADITVSCTSSVPVKDANVVTVTDNCSGSVNVTVEDEVSLPACPDRYMVTRSWTATDECGNVSTASQTITVFDDTAPQITCPGPLTIACGQTIPPPDITTVTATDNCSGTVIITWAGDQSNNQNPEIITRTYMATDECGNTAVCSQSITRASSSITCNIIEPQQYPFCGMINNMLTSEVTGGTPVSYSWTVSSTDPGWTILSGSNTSTIYYNAGQDNGTFSLTTTDDLGCTSTFELPMNCVPAGEYCSMTHNAYGNPGGIYCNGMGTLTLVNSLIGSDPLVVGWGGNTMTFNVGEGQCVIDHLPGSGPAKRITGLNTCSSHPGIQTRTNNGKIYNILLAQNIAYGLNLRLSPNMEGLLMETSTLTSAESTGCGEGFPTTTSVGNTWEYHTLPANVWEKLLADYGPTPAGEDLFDLANRALGNDPGVPTSLLTPISDAVAMMNESFDECMWGTYNGGFIGPTMPYGGGDDDEPMAVDEINYIQLNIVPNPFHQSTEIRFMLTWDTRASVEIYNLQGILLKTLFDGMINADLWNTVTFDADPSLPQAVYICVIRTDKGTEMKRMILIR